MMNPALESPLAVLLALAVSNNLIEAAQTGVLNDRLVALMVTAPRLRDFPGSQMKAVGKCSCVHMRPVPQSGYAV